MVGLQSLGLNHGQQLARFYRITFLHQKLAKPSGNLRADHHAVFGDNAGESKVLSGTRPPIVSAAANRGEGDNQDQSLRFHDTGPSGSRKRP